MRCLVTGGTGFIGSNLAEKLLDEGNEVVVLDNLSTGKLANIEHMKHNPQFNFIEGSICDPKLCAEACKGTDYVFHEAAFVSVPGSVENPLSAHETNVTGTVNVFLAAHDAGVKRVVWASSTSVYGDTDILPNVETVPLSPLSPYAASKAAGELYARAFSEVYCMSIISLRYYNVFGKRQDPSSQYAAAIPIFISRLLKGGQVTIFGDGEQTRDFVFIDNVVQANIKAAMDAGSGAAGKSFNIGCGKRVTINRLYSIIARILGSEVKPVYAPPRPGDVRHSFADIRAAREAFGYDPGIGVEDGIRLSIEWYKSNMK